jgi:Cdc6-like AAA superfamily ATPase
MKHLLINNKSNITMVAKEVIKNSIPKIDDLINNNDEFCVNLNSTIYYPLHIILDEIEHLFADKYFFTCVHDENAFRVSLMSKIEKLLSFESNIMVDRFMERMICD